MAELMDANREWMNRPDDQRFLSLEDLHASVAARTARSRMEIQPTKQIAATLSPAGHLAFATPDIPVLEPTHWSFGQVAEMAGAPAGYMRKLHPELARLCINYGIGFLASREAGQVYREESETPGEAPKLRAVTGESYGRIYDQDVVQAIQAVNADGRWQVPAASYATQNPKLATTLYASDRDVFIFLVDPNHDIEVGGERFFRGFFVWNSEVGSKTFGLSTFLYRYVCDNRIIWGARDVKRLTIRHSKGGPERFLREGQPMLQAYAEASTAETVATIKRAQEWEVARDPKDVTAWLRANRFSLGEAQKIIERANEEEGESRTLWNLVNGATALARGIKQADERVNLESRAGALLAHVEGKAA